MRRENTSVCTGDYSEHTPHSKSAVPRDFALYTTDTETQQKAQTVQRPTQNAMAVINSYTPQVNFTESV